MQIIPKSIDPFGIMQSQLEIFTNWTNNPSRIYPELFNFFGLLNQINMQVCRRCMGEKVKDPILPNIYDERFQDEIWFENPIADFIKEYYLLSTHWIINLIFKTPETSELTRKRAAFWSRQLFNAMSPTNSFFLNPRAITRFFETGGKSLMNGLRMLVNDTITKDITMVNSEPFKVGQNIAATKGNVIFRNEIFELIQYTPVAEKVHTIPILIVPPWINKFYILDLNSKKSLIQYLLKQNYTVFIISWCNPQANMRNTTFEDYLFKGILQASEVVKAICKVEQIHAVGYCIGGTALATLMAWLNSGQQEIKNNPIAHFTLLCTLLTFENPGEIGVFIDEASIEYIERIMAKYGYLDGKKMEHAFRMLRSNSLVWSYFTTNYLLGKEPISFDILFWNTDGTRLPEKMHSFYLRNFYLKNKLAKNTLSIENNTLDLGKVKQPVYAVGTEQDHITPWQETFKSIQLMGGEKRYILATSGHIMGILSEPVTPPKRRYWPANISAKITPESWLKMQEKKSGSWWEDWDEWLDPKCGKLQKPPTMGNEQYPIICSAPGTYVLKK